MNRKNKFKAIVAFAVALAFILPTSAVFANDGTMGITPNIEDTGDMESIVESTNSDDVVSLTGKTWYVGSGAGNDSTTIQGGIDLADPTGGDTVYVYNGLYPERITITKQLDLIGQSRDNTIIDGDWDGASWKNIVYVKASGVNISGFMVEGRQKYNIYYYMATGGTVRDCNVNNSRRNGIYLYKATGINIINCNVYDSEDEGIYMLYSPYVSIIDCDVYNSDEDGIHLYQACDHAKIINCTVYGNYWSGIHPKTSLNITITNCTVHNNSDYGIEIESSLDCTLDGNALNDNYCNFGVIGGSLSYFEHDIAPTNEANGRPIYWLSGLVNETFDGIDFGILGLISCKNVTVNDSDVYGVLLAGTTDSTLSNISSHDTEDGFYLCFASDNNEIINCNTDNCGSSGIDLYGCSYNNITNCNVYSIDSSANINLNANSNNNIITNCNISGSVYGSGIYIYKSSDNAIITCKLYHNNVGITVQTGSYRTSIVDCEIDGSGGIGKSAGIKVDGGSSVPALATTITRCNISNGGMDGIYLRRASGNIVTDCNVYNHGFYQDAYYGFRISSSPDNVLRGNKLFNNVNEFGVEGTTLSHFPQDITAENEINGRGIYYLVGQDGDILHGGFNIGYLGLVSCTNILVMDADVGGVVMAGTTGSILSNVNSHDSISGIYLHTSSGNNFIDCDAYSNGEYGFYLRSSTNNEFINCEAYDNPDYGISMTYSSTNNNITNCNSYNNKYGIYFDGSSGSNIITDCNMYDNSYYGLYLYTNCNSNVITNCNVHHNSRDGIYIRGQYNTITDCNVYDNAQSSSSKYGIYLYYGNNVVYHNSILRNNPNARDKKTTNTWDNGYSDPFNPITDGGNYWHDYTGVDLFHGPGQDIPGPDGIGDTPYNPVTYGQDNYPLMFPWKDITPPEIKDVVLTTSDPLDTIIGWEKVTCTVTDLEVRDVKLVVTNPDTTISKYPMSKSGGYTVQCSCEITLTDAGDYTYHVWADDTSSNNATSTDEPFELPPNWDVNMNGETYIEDFVLVAGWYGVTGPNGGWIREDVSNNGEVYIEDFVIIAGHYGERWKPI